MLQTTPQNSTRSSIFLLGLTGSIATGKSTVLNMFKELGYLTFSADDVVHALYKSEAVETVKKIFPASIIKNQVDRDHLASIVINHPEKITTLEAAIHPLVHKKYEEFLQEAKNNNERLLIIDIPLLFETKNTYDLDAVAVTFCDEKEQYKRAMARLGMSEEKFATIVARQLPQIEKRRLADFEIDTNVSLARTREQVVEIAHKCITNRGRADTVA